MDDILREYVENLSRIHYQEILADRIIGNTQSAVNYILSVSMPFSHNSRST